MFESIILEKYNSPRKRRAGAEFGRSQRWSDDDSGDVAGQNDELAMQEAAHGTGRRCGASRRDDWASRAPRIGIT